MKKFCPKCGKSVNKGVFCSDCTPLTLEFKPVKVKLCPTKKYFFRGKWKKFDDLKRVTEDIVKKTLNKKVRIIEGLEQYVDLLEKTGIKKDFDILIHVDDGEFSIPVSVEVTTSPGFSKVGSSYFEGILQLRNADLDVKNFVNSLIKKTEDLYVNKVVEKQDSVDFYFVKKKFIGRIADKLAFEYGAFVDHNAQLFSQDKQTSKELFRLNVAVHIPPFRRWDVILKNGDLILVTSTSKGISGKDLFNDKNVSFKYHPDDAHEYSSLSKQKTKIISTRPLVALSTESYQGVELENPNNLSVKKDQNVVIVEHNGRAFLIK